MNSNRVYRKKLSKEDIINEIEIGNNYCQDGLDYEMDCVVTVNKVRTRCDQISVVQCDMTKKGKGIELLLELRRGDFITWIFIDDIVCLEVSEFEKQNH